MRIVCISDTHGHEGNFKVPDGDLLIHAGDVCNIGLEQDVRHFAKWFGKLPHRWKVMVAGNHDMLFERQPELARSLLPPDVHYLQDSGCTIEGLSFWGSPWQPRFQDLAFNLPRKGKRLREKWNQIPADVDVLITHTPPFGVLDKVRPQASSGWDLAPHPGTGSLGCELLAERLLVVYPKLHVFGHIHDGHGGIHVGNTLYVNASICGERYRPTNRAIVVEMDMELQRVTCAG
jgi:Icc-related predicted phosphoesterase